MTKTLFRIGLIGGLALAVLAPASAWLAASAFGRDVLMITPLAEDLVAINQATWAKGDPVPEIYGTPTEASSRVVFADPVRIVIPKEDPSLTLLKVDKQAGENPLQTRTLWFFARWVALGGLAAAALSFAALRLPARPRR